MTDDRSPKGGPMDLATLGREAAFADAEYAGQLGETSISGRMLRKYTDPRRAWDWRQRAARLLGDVRGKRLLDYGCGQGEEAAYLRLLGAIVTAIDVSEVGLAVGRARAVANGLDIDFRRMDCLATDFPDGSFEVVHGMGILHHVGLAEGLAECHRLLIPGGVAVFLEPLGSVAWVEAIKGRLHRRLAHRLDLVRVTEGERNLRLDDLRRECRKWRSEAIEPYHLTHRAKRLLIPRPLWDWSLRLDRALLACCPPLARFAGAAVIRLVR